MLSRGGEGPPDRTDRRQSSCSKVQQREGATHQAIVHCRRPARQAAIQHTTGIGKET